MPDQPPLRPRAVPPYPPEPTVTRASDRAVNLPAAAAAVIALGFVAALAAIPVAAALGVAVRLFRAVAG